MSTSLTAMAAPPDGGSDVEDIEHHGDESFRHHDQHDGGHDRGRGGEAHRGGAAAALDPAHAPGERDQDAEYRPLDDPEKDVREAEGVDGSVHVLDEPDAQDADADDAAADDGQKVRIHGKDRHH